MFGKTALYEWPTTGPEPPLSTAWLIAGIPADGRNIPLENGNRRHSEERRENDPVAVPSGAILTVADPRPDDDDSIVECKWGRMLVFVRAFDLRERGERIEAVS